MKAIKYGNLQILSLLMKNRANLNLAGSRGWTPIYQAIDIDNVEALKCPIDHGAKVYTGHH